MVPRGNLHMGQTQSRGLQKTIVHASIYQGFIWVSIFDPLPHRFSLNSLEDKKDLQNRTSPSGLKGHIPKRVHLSALLARPPGSCTASQIGAGSLSNGFGLKGSPPRNPGGFRANRKPAPRVPSHQLTWNPLGVTLKGKIVFQDPLNVRFHVF